MTDASGSMITQTHRIQPFRAHDGDFELLLAPGWAAPTDWLCDDRESEAGAYDRRTHRRGDAQRGLEVVHDAGYEPRGGGHAAGWRQFATCKMESFAV